MESSEDKETQIYDINFKEPKLCNVKLKEPKWN